MITLDIEVRKSLGKAIKNLPKGFMPAVYYGHKEASTPISVSRAAVKKVLQVAGESSVVVLKGAGKDLEVLIHEIDFDPIKGEPRHADFYVLEKGKKVRVSVPLHFEGVSPAVKNLGGIIVKVLHEVEVEAEPHDLPHSISVNVESLENFESKIHVKDVVFPKGVVAISDQEEVVALVSQPREEKEEETTAPDLSTIEVEKKGKKEEEGAETAEATAPEK